ncbi:hypothetical protein [Massilia sp. 9096]|uniref:hypothetical protein n=1 Tax=Massilia sp. 9096 TaxID=1500894 RepID=UPI0005660317|nr:hypothetical protein [Massilia sp. 9096]
MKQRIEKLALAAEVRTLAVELRNQKRSLFYASVFPELDENVRQRKLDQWDNDNPLDMFLISAIVELDNIVSFIERYREAPQKE